MRDSSALFYLVVSSLMPLIAAGISYVFFIVSSLAVARSRVSRLEELQSVGSFGADQALSILGASEAYLLCAQVGRFLSSLAAGILLATAMRDAPQLLKLLADIAAPWYSSLLSILLFLIFVSTTLILVQIAKAVAIQFPERLLCLVALPLRAAYTLFGPIVVFIHSAVSTLLSKFDVKRAHERDMNLSVDDLSEIVKMGSQSGAIEKDEQELFEGVVELSDRIVREVMTPRADVVYVRESVTTEQIVAVLQRERVSRLLICGTDLDDVKGVLLAKDLIRFVGSSVAANSWKEFIRAPYFVPNTKHLDELLHELRNRGVHIAVVLDEHGGLDGIVTLEDLVEEIVGDINDEFDKRSDRQEVDQLHDGSFLVDGGVLIEELASQYNIKLPRGDYETVAGFVLAQLGQVPAGGESLVFDDVEFTVQEVIQNRVVKVGLHRVVPVLKQSEEPETTMTANTE